MPGTTPARGTATVASGGPGRRPSPSRLRLVVLLAIAGGAAALVLALMPAPWGEGAGSQAEARAERLRCADPKSAHETARRFVLQRLRQPGSARFARLERSEVTSPACGQWRVVAHVDAVNGLGRRVRTDVVVELEYRGGDRWRLRALELQGRDVPPATAQPPPAASRSASGAERAMTARNPSP
jgi:hypothetical protein